MQSKSANLIVLSGGTSVRFGSDKSQALLNGASLISRILAAIPSNFSVVIVGEDPKISGSEYICVQENPKGGGPVAGFKAGIDACTSELVVLVAVDMPFVLPSVIKLLNLVRVNDDAVIFIDANGFAQPLAAVYRRESIQRALVDLGDVHGRSMRELVSLLKVQEIVMTDDVKQVFMDIDTQADLSRAIAFLTQVKDNPQL
ncbi:unannotated protein [freshwater metagenome]|uniref:Unannotated protein n=1 Tax=freshwater metagenome TaxID=449393 RepID=A0A6J7DPJ8_9ZZZZ